jgi:magnesium transporter
MSRKKIKPETAGAIMKKEFLAVSDISTIEETIRHFRGAPLEKVLKPSYIYAIDSGEHLLGVVQMRDLLSRSPDTYVKDIMLRNVIKVDIETDIREVMRIFVAHKFLALPVIDKSQRLVGIVTADDMVDAAGLQADKDIAMIVGTSVDEITSRSIPKIVKLRLPWLVISILSGLTCAFILGWFEYELKTVIALALFTPIVLGISESTAMQSATIVVRNIALGKATLKDVNWLLQKEILVGVIVGLICGVFVGGTAAFWQGNPNLGGALALSMSLAIIVAGVIGSFLPLLFRAVSIDPALASGPIVLAVCDVITLLIYFNLAGFLLIIK